MSYYKKRNKYHNTKIKTEEGTFDSKEEYKRFKELKHMEASGIITDLQRQVTYELIPKQVIDGKCIERACSYKADFVYSVMGKTVVEDVKGYKTPEYRLKRKLMLWIHKIQINEV